MLSIRLCGTGKHQFSKAFQLVRTRKPIKYFRRVYIKQGTCYFIEKVSWVQEVTISLGRGYWIDDTSIELRGRVV